jgi:mannosyltransferase OCH1-like enzyme
MTENIILLRHYIFINPTDVLSDINNDVILNRIKEIHTQNYTNCEIVKYYGYNDIVNLLNNYDYELCKLFLELNCNYPALLADIGRLIILYTYGGIYHDLKCMSNKKIVDYLKSVSSEIELIGEEHPIEKHRVRNTNIVALHKNSNFIKSVLEKIKKILETEKDAFGHQQVFNIGSGIYINEFLENTNQCIYKYPFENTYMLKFNSEIYSKNIKKWQNTDEYIFKKSAF